MIKPKEQFLPGNRQGITIDALTALLNVFIFPFFSSLVGKIFDQSFRENQSAFIVLSILMLLIFVGRLGGLYLKRFPLQSRLINLKEKAFPTYFFILNIPIFSLTAVFVIFLLMNLSGIEPNDGLQNSTFFTALIPPIFLTILGVEAYLFYRLSKPLNDKEKELLAEKNWKFSLRSELLADFGLFAYMMIWQVFYNFYSSLFLNFSENLRSQILFKLFVFVILIFVFSISYIAPRTVFLIEDRKYWGTWLFIAIAFISSIIKYF